MAAAYSSMSSANFCYFDNNATTPVAREVAESMMPFLTEMWANASSPYRIAREIANHVETARTRVAALINADPEEIVFTSGGTESINSAIQSALLVQSRKCHVVTTAVEHSATLRFCDSLESRGFSVSRLPVRNDGSLDLNLLENAILQETAIVSVMWANNETGMIFPIEDIAGICRRKGVVFHTDAVQIPGKMAIDVERVGVDLLSLSAHKLYAPKGIGALYVRRGTKYSPYIIGGQQEGGRRGGTENVANIVAFGTAAELARSRADDASLRIQSLRDRLERAILETIPDSVRNGTEVPRLPNTSNISFASVDAEAVLVMLDSIGVCVSSGSACTTGSLAPSHVLTAMGIGPDRARASVRFSLGFYTTEAEVEYLIAKLPGIISKLRGS